MKITTSLTKEVVKNNLPNIGTLIRRWAMFGCKPVILLLQFQVFFQCYVEEQRPFLDESVEGFNKGLGRTRGLLSKPERMLETDEDD